MVRGTQLVLSLLPSLALGDGGGAAYFPSLTAEEKSPYTAWLSEASGRYARHGFLPSSGSDDGSDGAAIFWTIDGDGSGDGNGTASFAVAVRAGGWVGLGLSEAGGMRGSDVAIYESSTGALTDAHVVDELAAPVADDCQSWDLADAAVEEAGWLIVEMTRALDTYDSQDHPIRNDVGATVPPTRLIAAWGDGDSVSFHGTNRARGAYRLRSDSVLPEYDMLLERLEEESDGYFEIREDEHEVKAVDTDYHDVCKTADELGVEIPEGNDGITMIGYVPVIDEDTRRFVHHFVVSTTEDCSGGRGGAFDALGDTMVSAWAPGDTGTMFPDNVGVQMLGRGKSAITLQIHYDNPGLIRGKIDSSGMRYYYVFNKREHNAGMLQIGDPLVTTRGAISPGLTSYSYSCPGSCTEEVLDTPVTILVESLHMHTTGVRMTNEVKRNGRQFHLATSEVYDFDQQGSFAVQQEPYDLMPGDSFKTTCYYRDGVRFGLSSQEEMCIAFILYYPEKTINGFGTEFPWMCAYMGGNFQLPTRCAEEMVSADIPDEAGIGRTFGRPPSGQCGVPPPPAPPEELEVDDDPATDPNDDVMCTFCPGGLTVDAASPLPAGPDGVSYNCGQISQFASFLKAEDDGCGDILMAEPLCCPSDDGGGTCSFCKGLAVDSEKLIPETEFTCGDLSGFAVYLDGGSDDCANIMPAEALCCQANEEEKPAGPCGFCSEGLTADAETPLPVASDGISYTCGQLTEFVDLYNSDDDECKAMLLAAPLCCPKPCGFCPEGLTADADTPLPAGSNGISYTCGQLAEFVNIVVSGSDECNDMLMAEPLCCPSSSSEEDTSEPINSTDEIDEPADSADESDPTEPDQDSVQSDPAYVPNEDAVDTNEDSDASSLSAVSLASILCIAIACMLT